jgi:hypothetical protein
MAAAEIGCKAMTSGDGFIPHQTQCCFVCGMSFLRPRGNGRFCSSRCRDGYDAGLPAYDENYVRRITALAEKVARRTITHAVKFRRKNGSKNKRLQGHFSEARVP